jgi:hypothetical protein
MKAATTIRSIRYCAREHVKISGRPLALPWNRHGDFGSSAYVLYSGRPPPSNNNDNEKPSRLKKAARKSWMKPSGTSAVSGNSKLQVSVLTPSDYHYRIHSGDGSKEPTRVPLPYLNASSVLDPSKYCRSSANSQAGSAAMTHGVSRSISGTDAARRLLRGKKEFVDTVRSQLLSISSADGSQRTSHAAILSDHGVPIQLLQNCINMADALLWHYGNQHTENEAMTPDLRSRAEVIASASELSFHNYYQQRANNSARSSSAQPLLPQVLRVRARNTNKCTTWPPNEAAAAEWNHNMSLYLTVMERLASKLCIALKKKRDSTAPDGDTSFEYGEQEEDEDVTASPLLFGNSSYPMSHVDFIRGSFFDIARNIDGEEREDVLSEPLVLVDWVQSTQGAPRGSSILGHVMIRMQGRAFRDSEMHALLGLSSTVRKKSSSQVTMVFDSCFRQDLM